MTQTELADRLGVSFQSVADWERCVSIPEKEEIERTAELFDVPAEELLDAKKSIAADSGTIEMHIENSGITMDFLHDSMLYGKNKNHG